MKTYTQTPQVMPFAIERNVNKHKDVVLIINA